MLSQLQYEKLDQWIRSLLWEGSLLGINSSKPISIHRTKGRIILKTGQEWILQGVRELYEFKEIGNSPQEQESKIVLIGEGLKKLDIEKSLKIYLGV